MAAIPARPRAGGAAAPVRAQAPVAVAPDRAAARAGRRRAGWRGRGGQRGGGRASWPGGGARAAAANAKAQASLANADAERYSHLDQQSAISKESYAQYLTKAEMAKADVQAKDAAVADAELQLGSAP